VFAEIGDDRSRFAEAKGLKAFSGAAPVTWASGKSPAVMARRVKNQRLAAVGHVWAFSALAPPEHGPTTTADEKPETGTQPPSDTSSTDYSAASTTASPSRCATTKPPHSHHPRLPNCPQLLDSSTASDVFVAALESSRTSWCQILDALRLGPTDDVAEVTAGQVRRVVEAFSGLGIQPATDLLDIFRSIDSTGGIPTMGRVVVFVAGGRPPARQPHRSAPVLLWPEGSPGLPICTSRQCQVLE
jgi:hypothetical protein